MAAPSRNFPAEVVGALQPARIIDLTFAVDQHAPFWPEVGGRSHFVAVTTATIERDGYFTRTLQLPEHFGTHLDAPAHFDSHGLSVDQIPAASLVLPLSVVDVRASVGTNPDYRLSVADLEAWEHAHGTFRTGSAVLMLTGWGSRWPSQQQYLNQDAQGVMHFPGFSPEAAQYLLDHARPKAIGIDTYSVDYGLSQEFEVHRITLPAGLYQLECLANLEQVPPTGATLIALPLKLRGGSGASARVLAIVGNDAPPAGI